MYPVVCLGMREFPGHWTFHAKTKKVSGKLGQVGQPNVTAWERENTDNRVLVLCKRTQSLWQVAHLQGLNTVTAMREGFLVEGDTCFDS